MGNPKISLMIYGTRLLTSGWEPLIMLNNPPFQPLANIGVAGVGENPTYYTLRIDQNYTQYTLVYNPKYIKAHASQRDGALKISISIPKGYKLDDGATPFNVFIDIQRALEEHALSPIVGKPGAFEFKATFPSEDVFAQVLNSFKLVETKMPHRPMSPTSNDVGMIIANEASTDSLFNDVQYPEFSSYREIAIAQFGDSENIIKNLDIPRKAKYEIFANSSNITNRIKSYNYGYDDSIIIDTLNLYSCDKGAYEGEVFEFTVNEVLNGKYSSSVFVDKERECIRLTVNAPKKKKVSYQIKLEGCNKLDVFKYLRAYVNRRERKISASNTIELVGEELLSSTIINVIVDGKKYKSDGEISIKDNIISVPVKEIPRPWDEENGFDDDIQKKNAVIEFKLVLEDPDDIGNCQRHYRVRFYNEQRSFSLECVFNINGRKGYAADIIIPAAWSDDYYISIRTDRVKIAPNYSRPHSITLKTKELKITKDETEKLSWRDKMSKSGKLLLCGLMWIVSFSIVACCSIWIDRKYNNKNGVNKVEALTGLNGLVADEASIDSISSQILSFLTQIQKKEIQFDEIKQMDSWLSGNLSKLDNNNGGLQFKAKIDAYMQLIAVLEMSDNRKVGNIQSVANSESVKKHIEPEHWECVSNVWSMGPNSNGQPVLINKKQEIVVNDVLKKNIIYYDFIDIPSAREVLGSPQPANGVHTNGSSSVTNLNDNSGSSSSQHKDVRWE